MALPADYYYQNFTTLTEFVFGLYADLLATDDIAWYETLQRSDARAGQLYVRLLLRRGNVFRMSRLAYDEIGELSGPADELANGGLVSTAAPACMAELLAAFTLAELKQLLPHWAMHASRRSMVEAILDADAAGDSSVAADIACLQSADRWLVVQHRDVFERFCLCFFGNPYQDLSEFVMRDLGTVRYEAYVVDAAAKPFVSREQLNAHLQCLDCDRTLSEVDAKDIAALQNVAEQLPVTEPQSGLATDPHLCRRVDRLRNTIARQLERLNDWDAAIELYRLSRTPPCREREVRLLMGQERWGLAHEVCIEMVDTPRDDTERQFAEYTLPKIQRARGEKTTPRPRFRPRTTRLTLQPGADRVEFAAQQYYERGGRCFYVENTLFTAVLGLFIWDIMYLPVHGAFFNPFQSAPADFNQPEFVDARRDALHRRFQELATPAVFADRVRRQYAISIGISNALVSWRHLSPDLLELALERIPVAHWQLVFERILSDVKIFRKGLPDLIVFPDEGGYELVEIKGPGDALQKHQRRWLAFFDTARIPSRCVEVRWAQQPTHS